MFANQLALPCVLSTFGPRQHLDRAIFDYLSRFNHVKLILSLHQFPRDQFELEFPYDPGSNLLTTFLRATINCIFFAAWGDLEPDKFTMSTLMDSCNWVDTGQGRNHLSFLWFILKDLVREEKIQRVLEEITGRQYELSPYILVNKAVVFLFAMFGSVHKSWSTSQVEDFQGSGNFQCVKKVFFEHIHETKDGVFFIKTHDGLTLVLCGPKQQGANQFILQELAAQGLASMVMLMPIIRGFHNVLWIIDMSDYEVIKLTIVGT